MRINTQEARCPSSARVQSKNTVLGVGDKRFAKVLLAGAPQKPALTVIRSEDTSLLLLALLPSDNGQIVRVPSVPVFPPNALPLLFFHLYFALGKLCLQAEVRQLYLDAVARHAVKEKVVRRQSVAELIVSIRKFVQI